MCCFILFYFYYYFLYAGVMYAQTFIGARRNDNLDLMGIKH